MRNGNDFLEGKSSASPLTDFSLILFLLEKRMKKLRMELENSNNCNASEESSPLSEKDFLGLGIIVKLLNLLMPQCPNLQNLLT